MARTDTERTLRVPEADEPRSGVLGHPAVLIVAIVLGLVAFGYAFLQDPSMSAATRDPAWYTWRSNLMMHADPKLLVGDWGPFAMFAGGYRVAVPLYGSILQRVAGIDLYTFSAFMMVGIPVLTGLALGAFSYRRRRDPLLFLIVMLATAAMFMTTPYVGYLDNITVLFLLSFLLAFLEPARESWGARSAVFLTGMAAAFVHPTTCVIFGVSLLAIFVLHFLTSRFRLGPALHADGPGLLSAGFGMIFGLALWIVGPWGAAGSLADAALPPPYTQAVFTDRLMDWVRSMQPVIIVPLVLLGIGWTISRSRRERRPADLFAVAPTMWLIPLLGALGFLAGAVYPYYRFFNATGALFALVGLGAWVAVRWLLARQGPLKLLGALGAVAVLASLVFVFVSGREASRYADPTNQWIDQPTRTSLAAARSIVETEPGHPVVFLLNFEDRYAAYGWAKTFTNVSRTGLPGDAVRRDFSYFGDVQRFTELAAAGFPGDEGPTLLTDATYNKMSLGFYGEMQRMAREFPQDPVVFLVRQFNEHTSSEEYLDSGAANLVPLSPDVAVVTGQGLVTPSPEAVAAASRAEQETAALYEAHPGPLGNPLHTLRVLLGLAILLIVPGIIAMGWFEVEGTWMRIALVPGLSIVLTILAGMTVASFWRGPFSTAHGWASIGLATVAALGLRVGTPALRRVLDSFAGFFNTLFGVFSIRDYSVLMGVQFLVQAGQGVIQGAIGKSIAFGGEKGFDVSTVPSADYLLKVVLALYIPYSLVSPFIGVFIDRFQRRRVLAWANVITAVVVTAVAVGAMLPLGKDSSEANVGATVALVVGLLMIQACVRVALAVKSAAIPDVLAGKDLLQGNALSQAGGALFQIVGIAGALVGASLLPSWLVVIGGCGILIVATIVGMQLQHVETRPHDSTFGQEARRVVSTITAGLREVASRPPAALGLSSFQMLRYQFWGFCLFTFALYAKNLVQGGDASNLALGISGAGGFLGGALGLVLAQKWKDRVPPIRLLLSSMFALGVAVLVFGALVSLAGFAALLFVGFFTFFMGKISADTIMQQAIPDDFRGRAFALFDIAYNLGFIVPALVLSFLWVEDSASRTRVILMASGAVFLGLTFLVAAWSRRIRDQFAPQDDLV
ncbi:MAG: MFS transporter [Actinomycetota bacterium]